MKKRYNDGGLPDYEREPDFEDKAQQSAAVAQYKVDKGMNPNLNADMTFKEAFAAARKEGDKTFEWHGKKYTTEMASPKPKAEPKATPKAEPKATSSLTNREKEIKSSGMSGKFVKGAAPDERRAPTTSSLSKEERIRAASGGGKYVQGATPMKKGGAVSASRRGDGCAIRGKTRGRMV